MPVVLSFTVETDFTADDRSLAAAIQMVDDATDAYPAYYGQPRIHRTSPRLIRCPWTGRILALQPTAPAATC